ncbi:acylneuraminate cytidylyltransferase [Buttiauxella noackiae ATCC 51607]|uniref:Acylneuraminate cytidylyltransferase n=1 Tax=Buttiauxella noackiae ATCC 51607 TaxID=1354255 RepID=A0A1B7HPC8_9ENTR|nr:acylneuraminate cytidylyltransferase family protein [Buttiauxella noackiae]OAT17493.1 acylneuraminate cytidylyltransferase [Buttiauxella noackiae ATCC 51607]
MIVYAIVPARSGSKGLPNKNIKELNGKPLISYSIEFAKRLPSVTKVICSTDSELYADIAKKYGAEVPFLRSPEASIDTAMEQDILIDLKAKFKEHQIPEPDLIVWLRPTFVFRNIDDIEKGIDILKNDTSYTSARTVVSTENRLYKIEEQELKPLFNDFGKSMIRRQNMPSAYTVFSTDIIRFKNKDINDDFLGRKVFPIVSEKICGLDIDDLFDFEVVNAVLTQMESKNAV